MTRNEEICEMYVAGSTLQECGERFSISRERVRQILNKAGVPKQRRTTEKSDREVFLGVNLTATTKEALKTKAKKRGVSMSRMVSDEIDELVK